MGLLRIGNFEYQWGSGRDSYINTLFRRYQTHYLGVNASPQWVANGDEANLFETTPELYKVIVTKAMMYSNGVFRHYRMVNGEKQEVENSEAIQLLENPNPLQSRSEWMMEDSINQDIFGNSFMYGLKPFSTSLPSVLWNLPPQYMKVKASGKLYRQSKKANIVEKYTLCLNNQNDEDFDTNEILHSKTFNPDNPLVGLSPFVPLKMPISNIREAYALRNVILSKKGAIGILSNEKSDGDGSIPITEKERKDIENQFVENYGSRKGQRSISITNAKVKWTPMTFPTKDLMTFEEISEDTRAIIDAYGLNEYLFGRDKGTTFANLNNGKKIAYQDGIIPFAQNKAEKLTKFFGFDPNREWLEVDYSHIEALQENEKEKADTMRLKADAIQKLKAAGFENTEIETILGITL